jgi:hypothetical protein
VTGDLVAAASCALPAEARPLAWACGAGRSRLAKPALPSARRDGHDCVLRLVGLGVGVAGLSVDDDVVAAEVDVATGSVNVDESVVLGVAGVTVMVVLHAVSSSTAEASKGLVFIRGRFFRSTTTGLELETLGSATVDVPLVPLARDVEEPATDASVPSFSSDAFDWNETELFGGIFGPPPRDLFAAAFVLELPSGFVLEAARPCPPLLG